VVGLCACLFVTFVSSAKTSEPIEMPFGSCVGWTWVVSRNHVLDGGSDPHGEEAIFNFTLATY